MEKRHEADLKEILDAPHTNPPDELARRRSAQPPQTVGAIETFDGKKVITEGGQTLELHALSGWAHVEPIVVAYVPTARVLFQSDMFFPGTGAGGPDAAFLLESVRKLNLRVDTNVGGHGGIGPFAELVKAAGTALP